MTKPTLCILGRFDSGHLGGVYLRAFRALGVPTEPVEVAEMWQRLGWTGRNRIAQRMTLRSLLIRSQAGRRANQWLEERVLASGAKWMLILAMDWVFAETVERLRARGIRVAFFYSDNPFPPHYAARPETLRAARSADLCLVWSERLAEKMRRAGVPRVEFLPFAWDEHDFPYQQDSTQGTWPGVLFLGSWDRERELFLEQIARQVPLRIYGSDRWKRHSSRSGRVRECWQGAYLEKQEAAKVIRESAICLNILRTQHVIEGVPDGLIQRHFEVPGAGGFLLSTRGGGATTLFPEGQTGEYFSDAKECLEKIRKYLPDEAARRQIAERAHAEVAARHQYPQRAQQIMQWLEQDCATG